MDRLPASGSLVVEIYTRVFIRLAGLCGRKVRSLDTLHQALAALGSRPAQLAREPNDHKTDVLLAAAGLRRIARDPRYLTPSGLNPPISSDERRRGQEGVSQCRSVGATCHLQKKM